MPRQTRPSRDTARSQTPDAPRAIECAAASSDVPAVLPRPWMFFNGRLASANSMRGPIRPAKSRLLALASALMPVRLQDPEQPGETRPTRGKQARSHARPLRLSAPSLSPMVSRRSSYPFARFDAGPLASAESTSGPSR